METEKTTARLRDLLVEEGLVSSKQIDDVLDAIERQGGKLAETLIERGYLTDVKLEKLLASQPGIASVDLSRYQVTRELCELFPAEMALKYQVFPIDKMGKLLTVGMAVPIDEATIAILNEATGLRIKAMYCKPDHILGAIERYYRPEEYSLAQLNLSPEEKAKDKRSQGPAAMIRIANLLKNIDDLPALPETVERAKQALEDPNFEIEDVIEAIRRDPMVSAKVLKIANSAAFALPTAVDDVGSAVKLLGLRETYNLVLSSAVITLAEHATKFDFQRFWDEAMFAASAVRTIAAAVNIRAAGALSTAGLLHDIGRFGLSQVVPDEYAKLGIELSGAALVAAEEDSFGLGHPEAAYVLASRWDLPEEIYVPIRFHHNQERTENLRKQSCIVSLAGFLAESNSVKREIDGEAVGEVKFAMEELGLSAEQLSEVYQETAANIAA